MVKELVQKRWVQILLALFLGVTVGAVFYPTKTIEERVEKETSKKYELKITELKEQHSEKQSELQTKLEQEQGSLKSYKKDTTEKITSLTRENRKLKESSKRKRFKLVKPDGTIVEKEYEETNREEVTSIVTEVRKEFNEKIAQTEQRWKKVYRERLVKIKEKVDTKIANLKEEHRLEVEKLKKERIVKVNEKKLRVGGGYTTDKDVRVIGGYKLWGPFSIESGLDYREDDIEGFLGLGFEF